MLRSARLPLYIAVVLLAVFLSAGQAWATNVALGKPVTLNGSYPTFDYVCGGPPQAAASTITDGIFLPNNTCWQTGTIYWEGLQNSIDIDLLGTFNLRGAIVQADDNDTYLLQYRDTVGVYHDWWSVPQTCCFGMITRPNQLDNSQVQPLPTVVATGLRISGVLPSDEFFSVSEVQAFVPETGSLQLVLVGLVGLTAIGFSRRR